MSTIKIEIKKPDQTEGSEEGFKTRYTFNNVELVNVTLTGPFVLTSSVNYKTKVVNNNLFIYASSVIPAGTYNYDSDTKQISLVSAAPAAPAPAAASAAPGTSTTSNKSAIIIDAKHWGKTLTDGVYTFVISGDGTSVNITNTTSGNTFTWNQSNSRWNAFVSNINALPVAAPGAPVTGAAAPGAAVPGAPGTPAAPPPKTTGSVGATQETLMKYIAALLKQELSIQDIKAGLLNDSANPDILDAALVASGFNPNTLEREASLASSYGAGRRGDIMGVSSGTAVVTINNLYIDNKNRLKRFARAVSATLKKSHNSLTDRDIITLDAGNAGAFIVPILVGGKYEHFLVQEVVIKITGGYKYYSADILQSNIFSIDPTYVLDPQIIGADYFDAASGLAPMSIEKLRSEGINDEYMQLATRRAFIGPPAADSPFIHPYMTSNTVIAALERMT